MPERRSVSVMEGIELPCQTAAEVARVIRALGGHRYVAGRLLLLHAAALDAVSVIVEGEAKTTLDEAQDWSASVLRDASIDAASRDERLYRRASEKEVAAVLEALWGPERARAHARLEDWLRRVELVDGARAVDAAPFDENVEADIHPMLIDAGWELLALTELDAERHKGAIDAFAERIAFESARFEDAESIPRRVHLHELSAIGPTEAIRGVSDDGTLREPLVLYVDGEPTYLDYVLRGVLRSAKLG